jgi:hypothetical protein
VQIFRNETNKSKWYSATKIWISERKEGNACHHLAQNLTYFGLISEKTKIKIIPIEIYNFPFCFL